MKCLLRGECSDPKREEAVRRCLALALSRFETWIQAVDMDCREEDGEAAARASFHCTIKLRFRNNEEAVVSATGDELQHSIQATADRAQRTAARRWAAFQRPKSHNPTPGKQP